jgi:pantetheine-phosphate adenylyltransferase
MFLHGEGTMKICIYPGSFDPVTYGHIDIIDRACNTFDKVIVAIGINPSKKYTFSVEERIKFIKKSVKRPFKVEVMSFTGLLADFAYQQNVKTIIKGVRSNQDFDYERLLHEVTVTQQAGIDTHILIADQKLSHVSSSAAKELCKHQGLVHEYVPYCVKAALEQEINNQFILGITGSIGMGKSYVTQQLIEHFSKRMHVLHVDLDTIAHELYTRTEPVYIDFQNTVKDAFGLTVGDSVEMRKKLGNIVFNNENALAKLNNLARQPLLTLMRQKMYGFQGLILLNGALLVEANFLPLCNNNVVVVNTGITEQIENLKNRGLTIQQIQRRINCQLTNNEKINIINDAIFNNLYGTLMPYSNSKNNKPEVFESLTRLVSEVIHLR